MKKLKLYWRTDEASIMAKLAFKIYLEDSKLKREYLCDAAIKRFKEICDCIVIYPPNMKQKEYTQAMFYLCDIRDSITKFRRFKALINFDVFLGEMFGSFWPFNIKFE